MTGKQRYAVNGKPFDADVFGYDGCHKIYIADNPDSLAQLKALDYTLVPIEELPQTFAFSCPLRFIMSGDLKTSYCGQFEAAVFEGFDIEPKIQLILDDIADEIAEYGA